MPRSKPDVDFKGDDIRDLGDEIRAAYDRLTVDGVPPKEMTLEISGTHEHFLTAACTQAQYNYEGDSFGNATQLFYGILESISKLDGGSLRLGSDPVIYTPGKPIN